MPYALKGRNVLVTGGSRGLGAAICEKFAAEGCNVAVNYISNADAAQRVADDIRRKYSVKTCIIQGDAEVASDNERIVKETVDNLTGLDIIIGNAGWTRFARPGDIYDLSHEEWTKCWTVNVLAHLQLMQTASPILKNNPDGGVYIITSSIAGHVTGGSSIAYSVTKAAALHLMKHFAFILGPEIRVNAVLPGLLLTDWGNKYPEEAIAGLKEQAALKRETNLEDCAYQFVSIAKNTSMTGQEIVVDSGLAMGSLPKSKRSS
ncbi:uncharacterized protein BHQ10_005073 [Talaromyces amestolkiae]|uniref:Ketoreductase (KR) domain-containing protein n=1 Tax=Talaromyces amestolkiae TaxID=1196081 RepID=A0A364KZY9_TALAM|nr:uncharacterized protein BHQ10_005073 [Talaromyces amestolkiae]RAO69061.1 hypothetical protein BHQ10_005073 [Talaromyces amestolkiae]